MGTARKFGIVQGGRRPRFESRAGPLAEVWPEVSSHNSQEELDRAAAENSPGRVFLEVFLVLAVAGLMAIAAAIWAPIFS